MRQLIDNEYVEKHLDYYANQFLAILLAYKGVQSFEAGIKLAEIVKRFSDKYPHLLDIYDRY